MIIKGRSKKGDEEEIDGFPVVKEYKYLGILLDERFNIRNHTAKIPKKLEEYFKKDFELKKRYFSVKSIILIFDNFHKSRSSTGCVRF